MKRMVDLPDKSALPSCLHVRVTPKAKSERIKQEISEDGRVYYKVYVTVAPEDGKANKAVIKLLSETFDISKSAFTIARGLTSRDKIIQIKI